MNSEILLRRKNTIFLPEIAGTTNVGIIAAANLNLQDLGYTLSAQAINHLKFTSSSTSRTVLAEVVNFARKAKGFGAGLSRPMYPNFPEQVANASDGELYLNAILHYFTVWVADVTGDKDFIYLPQYRKDLRGNLTSRDRVKLTVLKVSFKTASTYREIVKQLVTSNTSISEQDKSDIRELVKAGFLLPQGTEIPNKENLVTYAAALIKEQEPIDAKWFQHGTDVLRLATALSDGDVSLAKNTRFVSFKRYQRRLLLDLLAKDKNISEAFARDRERFIRLGERLHPGEFKDAKYRVLRNAFKVLRAGLRLETFNGTVEEYLSKGQAWDAAHLLSKRPGEFARRLDHVLRVAYDSASSKRAGFELAEDLVNKFLTVSDQVSTPVLLQLKTHFENRNKNSMRVIMPKGEVSKIHVLSNGLRESMDSAILDLAITGIDGVLVNRFANLSKLGKTYVDPALKNYLVPFSQRSASASLRTITRGSRVPFSTEKDTLRFFVHWKNTNGGSGKNGSSWYGDRVDLDLSAVMYGQDWENQGRVWYGNLRDGYSGRDGYTAVHSGDITDAPNGAAEFIDIHIPTMIRQGARYIAMTVNKYAGPEHISQVPECFAGWMLRARPNSGEVFEPKTVVDRIDLTSESNMVIPMVIDLVNREMIWVDSEVSGVAGRGSNVINQGDKLALVGKAFTRITKTNLYDLLTLHAKGRGRLVKDESKADTVFSVEKGTQFELAKIASEFMGN